MKRKLLSVFLFMFIFTQGCCSIFTSSPQKVSVNSKPEGASVKIGSFKGTTPYEIMMPRGKDYVVVVDYQGKTQAQTLERRIEPVYWINILFFPGLIIDLATGSMFKYDPTEYEFDFTTNTAWGGLPKENVAPSPATGSPTMIKCENCGHEIGKLEKAYVREGHVVCSQCYKKLTQQQ